MNTQEIEYKRKQKDEEVKKMVEEWDLVRCYICGAQISMLTAEQVSYGKNEYFRCRGVH